jgi:hypothetical protein
MKFGMKSGRTHRTISRAALVALLEPCLASVAGRQGMRSLVYSTLRHNCTNWHEIRHEIPAEHTQDNQSRRGRASWMCLAVSQVGRGW